MKPRDKAHVGWASKSAAEASTQIFHEATVGREGFTFWTAEAGVDGSGWRAMQRTNSPPTSLLDTRASLSSGENLSFPNGAVRIPVSHMSPFIPYLGSSGSNIMNKELLTGWV